MNGMKGTVVGVLGRCLGPLGASPSVRVSSHSRATLTAARGADGGRGRLLTGVSSLRRVPATASSGTRTRTTAASTAPTHVQHVVIGGGVSGGYAMNEFAKLGVTDVALVSESAELPYERPALTKGFLLQDSPARLPGFHTSVGTGGPRQDEAWYRECGFAPGLLLGCGRPTVNFAEKSVVLNDGRTLTYDKLLIATGAHSVTLDQFSDDTIYIRSIADATRLVAALDALEARRGSDGQVVVIGGGLIGAEVAGMVSDRFDVTFLCGGSRALDGVIPAGADADLTAALGCRLRADTSVLTVEKRPEGGVTVVCADHEKYEADVVVAGIGARPATAGFSELVTTSSGHLAVSATLETSQKGVFAAGDCMAFPSSWLGTEGPLVTPLNNVNHARASARYAVRRMVGRPDMPTDPYDPVPHAYSRIANRQGTYSWERYGVVSDDLVYYRAPSPSGTAPSTLGTAPLAAVWSTESPSQVVGVFLSGGTPEQNAEAKALIGESVQVAHHVCTEFGLVQATFANGTLR